LYINTASRLIIVTSFCLVLAFAVLFSLSEKQQFSTIGPDDSFAQGPDIAIEDLEALSGTTTSETIRVIRLKNSANDLFQNKENALLNSYAKSVGRQIKWVSADSQEYALSMLANNQADILASLDEAGESHISSKVMLTMPFAVSKQQVIGRSDSNVDDSTVNLTVRQVAVKKSSLAWEKLTTLARDFKTMELLEIPENTKVGTILTRLKTGQYDLAVMDNLELPDDLKFRHNLEIILDISEESYLSWGVSRDRPDLQTSINQYLSKKGLESEIARSYEDDLPLIKQRKLLRVITYQSPVNYFYDHGRLKGFEYDLINRFSEHHGLRLDVVVADSQAEMLQLLKDGKGDVIAASILETFPNSNSNIKFSEPYNFVAPVLVGRSDELILDVADLKGRKIHLSPQSPYHKILSNLKARTGINFSIVETGAGINTETLLYKISEGKYDLTVLSSHEVKAELSRQVELAGLVTLGEPQPLKWAVRDTNTQLLSAVNEYLQKEYRKGFYNVIHARYIDKPDVKIFNSSLIAGTEQLSPYDEIVHKYSDLYGFDWRLVIAQMYQESRFNPHAVSVAGAEGLMQILPQTAEMIGVADIRDPDANIKGGLSYMNHIRSLFDESLAVEDRTWFTLASYNAGYRRVQKARKLAESMGLNKNAWFNNVEIAMLRLAVPRKYNGYKIRECQCGQTVVYVREIRTLYNNYLRLTQAAKAASRQEVRNDES
jgi:membrane-bound lytic murein transglycosylase F